MDSTTAAEISRKFRHAKNRLVLLDYDGTLVDHTSIPGNATLPQEMTEILLKLINQKGTGLFIITGRRYDDIDRFLNHIPVNILADHGAVVKEGPDWKNHHKYDSSWKSPFLPVLESFTKKCPGSFTEDKMFSIAWHYRNADPVTGSACSRELLSTLKEIVTDNEFRVLDGNKVVEILAGSAGKGKAVSKLMEGNLYDFILSIGDDATDEEMFEYFADNAIAYTVKVGEGITCAKYKAENINSVASLLNQMTE
jgi:trehalose 6-phosphate synthase/phosphatase